MVYFNSKKRKKKKKENGYGVFRLEFKIHYYL